MPDCEYCAASFDAEEEYLAHLRAEHEGELGRIDRRRVEEAGRNDAESGLPTGPVVLGLIVLVAVAIVAYAVAMGGGTNSPATDADPSGLETQPLPDSGEQALLEDVKQHPNEGTDHVPPDTDVEYDTTPPTSGPHYSGTVDAGVYREAQPAGDIVHTLEHGAVVIYYDPDALSPEAEESLKQWANTHTGTWNSVVVVPSTDESVDSPYVLTAWRHSLRLSEYEIEVVRAFLAEYLGRGPENPVR
jgi:hypothetical protein